MSYKFRSASTYFMKKRYGDRYLDHYHGKHLSYSRYYDRVGRRNFYSNLQGLSKRKWLYLKKGLKKIRGYKKFD